MKTIKKILILFTFLALYSCSKKTDEQPQPTIQSGSNKQAYEKKWVVNSSSARIIGTTSSPEIQSIEFMLKSYVVIYSNDSTIVGSYTALNDQTLYLSNFGTLHISSLGNNEFDFILEQTGKANIIINSSPIAVVSSSGKTGYLCNTWKLTKITSADTVQLKNYDIHTEGELLDLSVSQYGTYLYKSISFTGANYTVGKWNWTDANETSITITYDNNSGSVVETSFSPNHSMLKFSFMQDGTNGLFAVTEEYEIQ